MNLGKYDGCWWVTRRTEEKVVSFSRFGRVHFPVFQLLTVLRHPQNAIQSAFRNRQKDDDDLKERRRGIVEQWREGAGM